MDIRKEWFIRWIRHKDLLKRSIKDIHEEKEKVIIKEKKKTITAYFPETLHEIRFETLPKELSVTLILWNKKSILKEVIGMWDILIQYPHLLLIFYNPTTEEEKWLLRPAIHDKVADPHHLEEGLLALSEQIPFLDEKQ